MQIEYKRDLNHSYMVVQEDKEADSASYQIRMLQTNSINCLMACRMHKMNTHMLYYYDISSMQALKTLYEHQQIGYQALRLLFWQMLEVMEELDEYLLEPEGLLLRPDTVYFSAEPLKAQFCYLPGNRFPIQEQMRELLEYLLPKMNHQEPEAVALGYGLYKELSVDGWSAERMKSFLAKKIETAQQESCSADEEAEEETEKEGIRKKAMESFFTEEEEEKENPLWTAAAVLGGIAILGILLYLMYRTGVPTAAYLIMLAAAGASVLVLSVWIRKKDQEDTEKEMESFLTAKPDDPAGGRETAEKKSTAAEKSEDQKESGRFRKTARRPAGKPRETLRKAMERGEVRLFDKEEEQSGIQRGKKGENSPQRGTFCWKEERDGPDDDRIAGSIRQFEEDTEDIQPVNAEEHWRKRRISPQQLYQKTEPLYRNPGKPGFRLIPVSQEGLPEIILTEEETTVGKLEAVADVLLPFPTVSRLHAKLQRRDGRCFVTDLNSCNGTYINEKRLIGENPYELEDKDEVSFADIRYRFLKQ